MYAIVNFGRDEVSFWNGSTWVATFRDALLIASKREALALWRTVSGAQCANSVWCVKDWGKISERTVATTEDGIFA